MYEESKQVDEQMCNTIQKRQLFVSVARILRPANLT